MNQSQKNSNKDNNWIKQLLVVILLLVLPVLMVIYNGKSALEAIFWEGNSEKPTVITNLSNLIMDSISSNTLSYGMYDPENKFNDYKNLDYEVIYFSWIQFNPNELTEKMNQISIRGRTPYLVCEPWSNSGMATNYLQNIPKGHYDTTLANIAKSIKRFNRAIFLSWGHEMDQDLTSRYTWSGQDSTSFINAYKYVVEYLRKNTKSTIHWVWSPIAKKGCLSYWPGENYVDYIGFPIYSFPAWDRSYYGYIRDFKTTFDEKYHLVKSYNKPIFIVEFGVTGSEDFVAFWSQEAFKTFKQYPLLTGLFFFHSQDAPNAWGKNIPTPDWRMNSEMIKGLVDYYKKKEN